MNYKSLNIFLFFWNILFKVECSYNKFCIVKDYVGKKEEEMLLWIVYVYC